MQAVRALAGAGLVALLLCSPVAQGQSLLISEYVEGSSNNKAIEIANTGASPVDLATARIRMYFNGSSSPGRTVNLSGTLQPGGVHVVAHSSSVAEILNVASQTGGGGWFNGDDAIVLEVSGTVVDSIGLGARFHGGQYSPPEDRGLLR
jgi:hypothetical protein